MKLKYLSLSLLFGNGLAEFRKEIHPYTYEASVEHNFIPWKSTEWHQEEVTKSRDYTKKYDEFQQSYNAEIDVSGEGFGVTSSLGASFKDINSFETTIEKFHSLKVDNKIEYQDNVSLVQRVVILKACIDDDCHSKKIQTVVSYLNGHAPTEEQIKYWKRESFRYLNAMLLPKNAEKIFENDDGYARYKTSFELTTLHKVKKRWIGQTYDGEKLSCATNEVMTGICGSGYYRNCDMKNAETGKHERWTYTKIQCSDARPNVEVGCYEWNGMPDKGETLSCPADAPFLQGYCGSDNHKRCDNNWFTGKCCSKLGLHMKPTSSFFPDNFADHQTTRGAKDDCWYVQGGWAGEENVCPEGFAITRYCGTSQSGHCPNLYGEKRYWTTIQCCRYY